MVDLDQTLIHTTEQHCQQMSNKVSTTTLLAEEPAVCGAQRAVPVSGPGVQAEQAWDQQPQGLQGRWLLGGLGGSTGGQYRRQIKAGRHPACILRDTQRRVRGRTFFTLVLSMEPRLNCGAFRKVCGACCRQLCEAGRPCVVACGLGLSLSEPPCCGRLGWAPRRSGSLRPQASSAPPGSLAGGAPLGCVDSCARQRWAFWSVRVAP